MQISIFVLTLEWSGPQDQHTTMFYLMRLAFPQMILRNLWVRFLMRIRQAQLRFMYFVYILEIDLFFKVYILYVVHNPKP
jgi:hypothetical protein